MNNQNLIVGLIAVAVFGAIGYYGIDAIKNKDAYITTNGISERNVEADKATWTIKLNTSANDVKEASSKIKEDIATTLKFLNEAGITSDEICDTDFEINDKHRWGDHKKDDISQRYYVDVEIVVRTCQIDTVKKLRPKLDELISKGLQISSDIRYFYSQLAKLRIDMINEATKDSENRAKSIAKILGVKIKGLQHLSTGKFSISRQDSATSEVNDYYEEHSPNKKVRVVVNGTFNIG